ncbi:MAG: hypothetical protein HY782_19135 [Chloroflexi bacterium]|nr:hypothetical protein [Chloroflexota bacterium]
MNLRTTNYVLRIAGCLMLLFLFALVLLCGAPPARAMPEYAARVGEPCASCHVSPAGGGLRNVRGQAWIASDKPALVPSTADALKALGLQLPADMSIYTDAPSSIPTPAPLRLRLDKYRPLLERLFDYEGN